MSLYSIRDVRYSGGVRRSRSQSSMVLRGMEKYSEKARWVMPDALRRALMRFTVSILDIQNEGTKDAFGLVIAVSLGVVFIDAPASLDVECPALAFLDAHAFIGVADEVDVTVVLDEETLFHSFARLGESVGCFQNFKISHDVISFCCVCCGAGLLGCLYDTTQCVVCQEGK